MTRAAGTVCLIPGATTFEDAARAEPGNTTWIFSESCLHACLESAAQALGHSAQQPEAEAPVPADDVGQQGSLLLETWKGRDKAWRYLLMTAAGAIPGGYGDDTPPAIRLDILTRMTSLIADGWEPNWAHAVSHFEKNDTMAHHAEMLEQSLINATVKSLPCMPIDKLEPSLQAFALGMLSKDLPPPFVKPNHPWIGATPRGKVPTWSDQGRQQAERLKGQGHTYAFRAGQRIGDRHWEAWAKRSVADLMTAEA